MTLQEIKVVVATIREVSDDDESAHSAEDELRERFIKHVSENGPPALAEMAREVLKTNLIEFSRWCA